MSKKGSAELGHLTTKCKQYDTFENYDHFIVFILLCWNLKIKGLGVKFNKVQLN